MKTLLTLFALCLFTLPHSASATAYYIDFSTTTSGGNGLTTASAFGSYDAFAEVARSAGDIAFVRRGQASTTNMSDVLPTSDGSIKAPLVITADYDNIWGDFSTSSQTFTPTVGSIYLPSSASTTDAFPGKWIYVAGDCYENPATTVINPCLYAYEIATASSTGISLYLPYKGDNAGSAKNIRVMPSAPRWGSTGGTNQFDFNTDTEWSLKGLDLDGSPATGTNGALNVRTGANLSCWYSFVDMVLRADGTTATGLAMGLSSGGNACDVLVRKLRANKFSSIIQVGATSGAGGRLAIYDSFLDCAGASSSFGIHANAGMLSVIRAYDTVIQNCAQGEFETSGIGTEMYGRNLQFFGSSPNGSQNPGNYLYLEDYNGRAGLNRYADGLTTASNTFLMESTSSASYLRSGGGPVSIYVTPTTDLTTTWELTRLKLFEYPIYASTASKQYSVYFNSTSTTNWTANPTAQELWIECDSWVTAGTSTRKTTKSTGTLNFTGSTAWQSLSVTCQPSQSGILYLRGWYAKTKESTASNFFFVDGTPVIN